MYTVLIAMPVYLRDYEDLGSAAIGGILFAMSVTMAFLSPFGGRLASGVGVLHHEFCRIPAHVTERHVPGRRATLDEADECTPIAFGKHERVLPPCERGPAPQACERSGQAAVIDELVAKMQPVDVDRALQVADAQHGMEESHVTPWMMGSEAPASSR